MPFGFHPFELIIVLVLALLLFGPKRLPEMGSSVGKTIKEFQRSMREVTSPSEKAAPAITPASEAQQIASANATSEAPATPVTPVE